MMSRTSPETAAKARALLNQQSLMRFGMLLSVAILLATMAPTGMAAATVSSIAFFAAVIALVLALLMGERPADGHLTRWDEALAMFGISVLAGMFVDPVALQQLIEQNAAGGAS